MDYVTKRMAVRRSGDKRKGGPHHNHPRVRRWLSRLSATLPREVGFCRLPAYFENAIPAKLTTLRGRCSTARSAAVRRALRAPPSETCRTARSRTTSDRRGSPAPGPRNRRVRRRDRARCARRSRAATSSIDALAGTRRELVVIARAHVRHVHAQNPEQPVALALAQFPQRLEKALHAVVVFRAAAPIELCAKGRTRMGRMRTSGPVTCCRKITCNSTVCSKEWQ